MNNATILYVEDDLDIAEEVLFFLKKKIKTVYVAHNGEEGLAMFKMYKPTLVITDIQMPKLNGLEMIKLIREKSSEVPIIVISAFNEPEMLLKAIDSGVDSYLLKPIVFSELLSKIEKLIKPILLQSKLLESKMKLDMIKILELKEKELLIYKERMEYVFAGSNDGVFDWNICSGETYFSAKWKSFIGYEDYEIENFISSFEATVDPEDYIAVKMSLDKVFASQEKNYTIEFRQIHKKGHHVWILARGLVKYDLMGKPTRVTGTHTNITHNKKHEIELKEAKNTMQELFNEQNIVLSLFDKSDTVLFKCKNDKLYTLDYISKSIETYLGYDMNYFKSLKKEYASCIHKDDLKKVVKQVYSSIKQNLNFFRHPEYRIITKDNEERWVSNYTVIQKNKNGEVTHFIGYITDITELKIAQQRVEKLSITDELTKLYNRRHFNDVFKKEINRSKRDKKNIVFLMLDIDYFKFFNDFYGHIEGDNVLVEVANTLKTFTNRAGDNVFRLGGEEFGIIFFSDYLKDAKEYAKKLILTIENLQIQHENSLVSKYVTISVGMAYKKHDDNLTINDLYKKADEALYLAKMAGRNQLKIY